MSKVKVLFVFIMVCVGTTSAISEPGSVGDDDEFCFIPIGHCPDPPPGVLSLGIDGE